MKMIGNDVETVDIETTNENEVVETQYTQHKFIKPKSISYSGKFKSPKGNCSVVNSKKNGKRVTLSKYLMEIFDDPEILEIGFTDDGIALSKKLPENGAEFTIKKQGNKGVIYSSSLVDEITELFGLDFSDRVSITFVEAEEIEDDGEYPIIEIKVK